MPGPAPGTFFCEADMHIDKRLRGEIRHTVERILHEDIGSGDLTAALIPESAEITATIITREPMTLAGRPWVDELYRQLDQAVVLQWAVDEGGQAVAGERLCRIEGPARPVLTGERGALNLLQTLSATATLTGRYVAAVAGTGCKILDTRKTLPGLRFAQKHAVRCGGGCNHRIGLFDAILIKENHIASAGGIAAAVNNSRHVHPDVAVEIEVESLAELAEALAANVERVLLDNFDIAQLRDAVSMNRDPANPPAELEASGNLTLDNVREVAETGVDFVSIGALTKNVQAVDLSMRHEPVRKV